MSKSTYIIDGYNALHRVPEWGQTMDTDLAGARKALCAFCAEWLTSRRDAEKFIVVFDGDSSVSPFTYDTYRGIRIIYTQTGETADSRIIAIVEDMANPQSAVVVSDDGEIMKKCGMAGADIFSVREFLQKLRKPRTFSARTESDDDDMLTPAERNRITNDLKREWGID